VFFGKFEPSPVIRALGKNDELARGAIRFSFGKDNSVEDVDYLLDVLPKAIENLAAAVSALSESQIKKSPVNKLTRLFCESLCVISQILKDRRGNGSGSRRLFHR
jgi:hypothetical protein